ncbi:homoserine O-acetyltransferase [Flexibacter flexilis DSM 6793]|uniref:Homoserine O-acetyltransferase n=1 Tax=Flexibacter flexilis DSM 6793 TaxID=927664 RepID=A0A1I1HNT2_9BACT|nr:homoserine O-acetyltransferase [Flexibacter flexilis]SFC25496.1 homoserine O-acetyltransferase [Flexibacter flexilis DSM 6793]
MNSRQEYTSREPFALDLGGELPEITIAFHTYGQLNEAADNVIWVCHALTGNSDAADWWDGLIGAGKLFDPEQHFIVCANVLGSCYGSTQPLSVNPQSGKPYFHSFPVLSIRDMAQAHELLRKHLNIKKINTLIGGSLGGQQALEWAIINPNIFSKVVVTATNAVHSAWGIAFNEAQRLAIEADATWQTDSPEAGLAGLKAARATAMLSYRNYSSYQKNQTDEDAESAIQNGFKAASYQRYQAEKLVARFNAYSYYRLSQAMDLHDVGRGRGGVEVALGQIRAHTLVIGIKSDVLFPPSEQKQIARHIAQGHYVEIDSAYGHDGFLIENEKITVCVREFEREFVAPHLLEKQWVA